MNCAFCLFEVSLSIEYIGRSKADSFWLVDALKEAGEDADVRFQKIDFEAGDDIPDGIPGASEAAGSDQKPAGKPDHEPDDGPFVDVRILDERIGNTLTDLMLDVITDADPSVPLIIAAQSSKRVELERYISRGAEDVLRLDDDTSGRIAWSLRFAIDRHELLRVTQSAESRIRSVVEHLREGVLILDDDGRVMYANPATEDHLERPLLMLFGHELPFNIPATDDVVELPLRDGTMRYLSVHTGPVAWEGRSARLISLNDISTEHEARQQLRRAKREAENIASMKATFFANMSHELRLPLASIIGFAQLLEADIENGELREFARMIQDGGRGLLDTINDVLEMTRMESIGIEPTLEAVSVADLVAETVGLSSSLARGKDLILDIRGDTSIVVTADSTLLKRILINLIGNAIKFTDEGGVTVTYSRESPLARIDVVDTGIGMDGDFIPKMFDEFTQESSGRDRTHGGSGLGLAITRKLVDTLNGRIEVDSRKGEGTVMSVFLPLDPRDTSGRPTRGDDLS